MPRCCEESSELSRCSTFSVRKRYTSLRERSFSQESVGSNAIAHVDISLTRNPYKHGNVLMWKPISERKTISCSVIQFSGSVLHLSTLHSIDRYIIKSTENAMQKSCIIIIHSHLYICIYTKKNRKIENTHTKFNLKTLPSKLK